MYIRSCPHMKQAWFLAVVAFAQLFAMPNPSAAGEATPTATVRQSFRFDTEERHLLVPVGIEDQEYQFVVDTGCTGNIFDVSLRSHVGGQVDTTIMTIISDRIQVKRFKAPSHARVGSLPFSNGAVLCEDFTSIREHTGEDIHGILGLDFLKDWTVAIDFDNGRLDFLSPGTEPTSEWGERMAFAYTENGTPYFPARVGKDGPVFFLALDTGSPTTADLEEWEFSRLVELGHLRFSGRRMAGDLQNVFFSRVGRASQFRIGSFVHENLRLESRRHQNAIGLDYLRRFRVTIDFPRKGLYLAKSRRFAEVDRGSMCGASFLFKPDKVVVDFVDEKSPAYAGGVRAKDVLLALCGKPVSALKPPTINHLLRTEGKTITMALERNGKKIEATFVLKEYD